MAIVPVIQSGVSAQIKQLYQVDLEPASLTVSETKPEFEGDYTVVLFALLKTLKKKPEELGNGLGQALVAGNAALFSGFNVIKGFLNLTVSDSWWLQGYNRAHYRKLVERNAPASVPSNASAPASLFDSIARPVLKQALRGASALTPKRLKERLPGSLKKKLWTKM